MEKKITKQHLLERGEYVFASRLKPFDEAFPDIDDISVEYSELSLTKTHRTGCWSKGSLMEYVPCGESGCRAGGYAIGSSIHEMRSERTTVKKFFLRCPGTVDGQACPRRLSCTITITYTPASDGAG
jgi:hypothetical protein